VPALAVLCLVPIGFISAQTDTIPPWVKGIAGFWADDKISDEEFIDAIEFLIDNGIIRANQQHTTLTPENTLNVGNKLTIPIPDGWIEQSYRDPISGSMVYAIAEESTLDLLPPTMIAVIIDPIEHTSAEEQYLAELEKKKQYLKLFPCFNRDDGYSHGNTFYSTAYAFSMPSPLVLVQPQCDSDSYGIDEMVFDYSDGTAYQFSFSGKDATYDEFFDTFDNTVVNTRVN